MATPKLSAEEQAFFDSVPEDLPIEEEGDRTPAVEIEPDEEHAGDAETQAAPKAEDKKKAAAPAEDKAKKEPEKQKTVPHGAMEAERQRRKALEAELARERQEARERQARLDERLAIINEALAPKQEPPVVPDPEQDIFAYARYLENQIEEIRGANSEQQKQLLQRQQAEQQERELVSAYAADARAFAVDTPDFNEAYRYLINTRISQLHEMGYQRHEIEQNLRNDELSIAHRALSNGRSAAQVIYNLAKSMGYQPKAAGGDGEEDGKAVPVNPNGAAASDAGKEIDRLAANQEAAGSLSNAGSTGGGAKITLESIDRMKPDEFKAFVAKINKKDPKGYDKLMGKLMLGG